MKKLFVFVGDGGSGKTTLITELVRRYPERFRKVVTCTSRPRRPTEVDGEDYHFLHPEYFIDNPDLVLLKKTEVGYYYGTRKADLFPTTHHLLLTSKLTGIPRLVNLGCSNIVIVRISISDELKIARMQQRGDSAEMIANRLHVDAEIRSEVVVTAAPTVDLCATQSIDDEVEVVLRAC